MRTVLYARCNLRREGSLLVDTITLRRYSSMAASTVLLLAYLDLYCHFFFELYLIISLLIIQVGFVYT